MLTCICMLQMASLCNSLMELPSKKVASDHSSNEGGTVEAILASISHLNASAVKLVANLHMSKIAVCGLPILGLQAVRFSGFACSGFWVAMLAFTLGAVGAYAQGRSAMPCSACTGSAALAGDYMTRSCAAAKRSKASSSPTCPFSAEFWVEGTADRSEEEEEREVYQAALFKLAPSEEGYQAALLKLVASEDF